MTSSQRTASPRGSFAPVATPEIVAASETPFSDLFARQSNVYEGANGTVVTTYVGIVKDGEYSEVPPPFHADSFDGELVVLDGYTYEDQDGETKNSLEAWPLSLSFDKDNNLYLTYVEDDDSCTLRIENDGRDYASGFLFESHPAYTGSRWALIDFLIEHKEKVIADAKRAGIAAKEAPQRVANDMQDEEIRKYGLML